VQGHRVVLTIGDVDRLDAVDLAAIAGRSIAVDVAEMAFTDVVPRSARGTIY